MKLRVLGCCAGNGVMIHPFKKYLIAHIEPRGDYKTPENVQWADNFKGISLHNQLGVLPKFFKKPNIIIGHPNCGHSSALAYSRGKKLGDAKIDNTINLFIKVVNKYKPKIFLFENLSNLFKSFEENEFDAAFEDYHLIKYHVSMSSFGNSQVSRKRLVIIGLRKNQKTFRVQNFKLPNPDKIKLKKVRDLEGGLKFPDKELCHVREGLDTIVCMEKDFKKLSLSQVKEIWSLNTKKKWDASTTGKGNMKNLPGVYRNLPNEYPLTARKQNRQFNSKGDIMSPRELARIQGVPDDFIIHYDEKRSQSLINKGRVTVTKCPPYELGLWFYKKIIKVISESKKS